MKVVDLVTRIQNIWICIFLIFLRISRNFQSLLFWEIKEKERTFCAEAPGRSFLLAETPLAGVEAGERRAAGFRHLGRPAARGNMGKSIKAARGTY